MAVQLAAAWLCFAGSPDTSCSAGRNVRLRAAEEQIAAAEEKLHEAEQAILVAKRTEKLDPTSGIMQGSILTVWLNRVHDLPKHVKRAFVVLRFDDQEIDSGYCMDPEKDDPKTTSRVWNEMFTFNVMQAQSFLHLELWSASDSASPNGEKSLKILGKGVRCISLGELRNQRKHVFSIPIKGKHFLEDIEVHIDLQWVHSQVKLLEDIAQEWRSYLYSLRMKRAELNKRPSCPSSSGGLFGLCCGHIPNTSGVTGQASNLEILQKDGIFE